MCILDHETVLFLSSKTSYSFSALLKCEHLKRLLTEAAFSLLLLSHPVRIARHHTNFPARHFVPPAVSLPDSPYLMNVQFTKQEKAELWRSWESKKGRNEPFLFPQYRRKNAALFILVSLQGTTLPCLPPLLPLMLFPGLEAIVIQFFQIAIMEVLPPQLEGGRVLPGNPQNRTHKAEFGLRYVYMYWYYF